MLLNKREVRFGEILDERNLMDQAEVCKKGVYFPIRTEQASSVNAYYVGAFKSLLIN